MVWRWGEGKTYSGVPAQTLLGEMFYWDDIPPKGGKDELRPLDACHEGQEERESARTIADKSAMVSKQTKQSSLSSATASAGKWWWLSDQQTSKWSANPDQTKVAKG